jgi:ectoine hydroxylase-related dioxygenase (phytanoyl-CoA dioxygenase family)
VHFWIPFQHTDAANGCLRFVPGSHRAALLPHVGAYATNPHVLKTDYSGTVCREVPLRLGDVSIHTSLTLHASAPNHSNAVRKAWIIHFGDKPMWFKRLMQAREVIRRAAVHVSSYRSGGQPE